MSTTIFSYAQAAKRNAAMMPSRATAPTSNQSKDDSTIVAAVSAPSVASNDLDSRETPSQSSHSSMPAMSKAETEANSPARVAPAPKANRDNESAGGPLQHGLDEISRSTSQASRSNDGGESRKGRKAKKGRTADKDGDHEHGNETEPVKDDLKKDLFFFKEAAPPAVNPWAKRLASQPPAFKTPVVPAPKQSLSTATSSIAKAELRHLSAEAAATQTAPRHEGHDEIVQHTKVADIAQSTDDQPRRNVSRCNRVSNKDEKDNGLPPMVQDAAAFPDLKTSVTTEDASRKPHEKPEKTDKDASEEQNHGKRPKDKWVHMDFVPSVQFSTPMPSRNPKPRGGAHRGGREAGSARGTSASAASTGGGNGLTLIDKSAASTGTSSAKNFEARLREGSVATRGLVVAGGALKRLPLDGAPVKDQRDARRSTAPASADRRRESVKDLSLQSSEGRSDDFNTASNKQGFAPPESIDDQQAQTNGVSRDGSNPPFIHHPYSKQEGRSERARAGYRGGRSNGAGSVSHLAQQQAYPLNFYQGQQPAYSSRQPVPFSSPSFQSHQWGPGSYVPASSRGSRANGRPGPTRATGNGMYGSRAPVNLEPFEFNGIMPAQYAQFNPAFDPTIPIIQKQVEYYFSVDNLCKDSYLRSHMDGKGFVRLSVIAGFKRLSKLGYTLQQLHVACANSEKLEYVLGSDNVERLRCRENWAPFVLEEAKRDELARNEGLEQWQPLSRHAWGASPLVFALADGSYASPFSGYLPEQMYQQQPYMNGAHHESTINGGEANGLHQADAPLSAAVPEFSPHSATHPGGSFRLEDLDTFSNDRTDGLVMVVGKGDKDVGVAGQSLPKGSAIKVHAGTNGDHISPTSAARGLDNSTPAAVSETLSPEVVWLDGQTLNVVDTEKRVDYLTYRGQALKFRSLAGPGETPGEMRELYRFWRHFLMQNFNAAMYDEFRTLALEDAKRENGPSKVGLGYLLRYYKTLLSDDHPKPWGNARPTPEIFTLHYHDAMALEPAWLANGIAG